MKHIRLFMVPTVCLLLIVSLSAANAQVFECSVLDVNLDHFVPGVLTLSVEGKLTDYMVLVYKKKGKKRRKLKLIFWNRTKTVFMQAFTVKALK